MDQIPVILMAVLLDILIGEIPVRIHPVVHMGNLIDILRGELGNTRISGFLLTLTVASVFTAPLILTFYLEGIVWFIVSGFLLSTVISIRFLMASALEIKGALESSPDVAREKLSFLVSRDTSSLTEEQIASAAIETLTENLTDSVTAPLFYFILLGLPGAFLYRTVNTLDAMVGYMDHECRYIGWFPAKLDDALNYIPSRLTGVLIIPAAIILGMNWRKSIKTIMRDARRTPSPNSGFTMAAAAGALSVQLEKPDFYVLGDPLDSLGSRKIYEAVKLSSVTVAIFLLLVTGIIWVIQ